MYLGIDLGTSGLKVILMNSEGELVASMTQALTVSRPAPLWSEQDPTHWWQALDDCMLKLSKDYDLTHVRAIGLSGQMHGATLLDSADNVLRPAMLWNDGRCEDQCIELEEVVPNSRDITGNIIMPGFTAPKLLWVKKHEPELFSKVAKVLLPKDYLRFLITGEFATDMSDAAGTCWLDVEKRDWHDALLSACSLQRSHMPELFEGNQVSGYVKPDIAARWGISTIPVVAGAGDNAAGALGIGLINPGQAMISLGTSGVYFIVSNGFESNPEQAVHSFCHALPKRWHLMSVLLSAASCLQWFADNIARQSVSSLLEQLEHSKVEKSSAPIFLPYLSGERTPHNNPHAKGNFFGLSHSTDLAGLTYAVLEGVSFAFADGVEAVNQCGVTAQEITVIGGGARSAYWRQMLADILGTKVVFSEDGVVGPALGAARLAQLAINPNKEIELIFPTPKLAQVHQPSIDNTAIYQSRRKTFQALYKNLKSLF